ncbi:MAG: biotin--[acetyl-CoA-carboxylase] ligase [Chthoniobacterales bacterium]
MSQVEPLDAPAIEAACAGLLIGHRVLVFKEVTSTNDIVAQMAAAQAEGLVVFAERQTAGRGQYGRRWESAAGQGLWMSVLLRPKLKVGESAQMTTLLARTIQVVIAQELDLVATIEPPNDVYLDVRKVAGVLVEMRVETGGDYCAIAGMGINVNQAPEDFPHELQATAVSLATVAGRSIDRSRFAIALLRELETRYRAMRTPGTPAAS